MKSRTLLLLLALALPPGTSLHSAETGSPSVEDRLQRLESELGALRTENQQLRQELGTEGRAGQIVIKPAGREPVLAIGGLIQAQADALDKGDSRFTSANDRFYLRRARINATGKFLEGFDFRIEMELAGSLAETTGMRAQLTDAYINWNRYDFANVRIGQFKTPFGYEQLAADPKLFSIERSLVNDRLTVGRQIGVQVAGDFLDKRLGYATGVFNGTGVNTSANDNDDLLWANRVSGMPWQGKIAGQPAQWTAGANAFMTKDTGLATQPAEFGFDSTPATLGNDNIFTGQRTGLGVDTQFKLGRLELWAEYLRTHFEQSAGRDFDSDGWYVQATYFVVPKELQALVKFDTFTPNQSLASNSTDTWTFGLNYFIKGDDLKLQLDYLLSDVPAPLPQQNKLLLRLQVMF